MCSDIPKITPSLNVTAILLFVNFRAWNTGHLNLVNYAYIDVPRLEVTSVLIALETAFHKQKLT